MKNVMSYVAILIEHKKTSNKQFLSLEYYFHPERSALCKLLQYFNRKKVSAICFKNCLQCAAIRYFSSQTFITKKMFSF